MKKDIFAPMENPTIVICKTSEDFEIAKTLTKDYMEWLGMDLNFQNTENEFAEFDRMYNEPAGCFIYATINNVVAGGVAVRPLKDKTCEMKRLYVYPNYRGHKLGKILSEKIMSVAKQLGYKEMKLDTVSKLESAINLYKNLGFEPIDAYYFNPDPTAQFFGKKL